MRLLGILILPFLFLSCRHVSDIYEIEKINKVLVDGNECKIISSYPVLHLKNDASELIKINSILETINEMDRFTEECSKYFPENFANKKKEIVGDYNVLYTTDTLINIEFFLQFEGLPKVEYRNVFVDIPNGKLIEANKAVPDIDRGKLYPYVKKFVDSTGININLMAYESNSKYAIMFGRTLNHLVLYLGKEGEFGGYYKILIPIQDVKK